MISVSLRIIFVLFKFSFRHQDHVMPILKSLKYFFSKTRVSAAALLLLEKNGRYILIRNHHREEYFGPIGGVFKHSGDLPQVLHDIEWRSDYTTHEPKEADMKNDLRGVVPGRNLARFLEWFVSRKGREGDQALFREIDEELKEGRVGKIWRERSHNCKAELIRKVIEGPRAVENRPYQAQMRYFEIFKLDPACSVSEALTNELWDRASRGDNKLKLATKEEIEKGRFASCQNLIAGSTQYFFSGTWHGNEPSPY